MKAITVEKVGNNYRVNPNGTAPSTPPDTEMSDVSTNAVQNKVIKSYIDEHAPTAPDTSMSSTSTNAVQNKVIKAYVDNQISALREELIAIINAIPGIHVSDTPPTDTSDVWIDTGGN